jgi:hypothetical protein
MVDQSPVSSGLGHDFHAGLTGAPGYGGGVFLHGKHVPTAGELHVEYVHR